MACLHPHNSISNVVASVTIHDDMNKYIFIRDGCRKNKPLWKVKGFLQIARETWVLVTKDKSNHPVAASLRSVPQETWS